MGLPDIVHGDLWAAFPRKPKKGELQRFREPLCRLTLPVSVDGSCFPHTVAVPQCVSRQVRFPQCSCRIRKLVLGYFQTSLRVEGARRMRWTVAWDEHEQDLTAEREEYGGASSTAMNRWAIVGRQRCVVVRVVRRKEARRRFYENSRKGAEAQRMRGHPRRSRRTRRNPVSVAHLSAGGPRVRRTVGPRASAPQ
jgi:hypothetical protein